MSEKEPDDPARGTFTIRIESEVSSASSKRKNQSIEKNENSNIVEGRPGVRWEGREEGRGEGYGNSSSKENDGYGNGSTKDNESQFPCNPGAKQPIGPSIDYNIYISIGADGTVQTSDRPNSSNRTKDEDSGAKNKPSDVKLNVRSNNDKFEGVFEHSDEEKRNLKEGNIGIQYKNLKLREDDCEGESNYGMKSARGHDNSKNPKKLMIEIESNVAVPMIEDCEKNCKENKEKKEKKKKSHTKHHKKHKKHHKRSFSDSNKCSDNEKEDECEEPLERSQCIGESKGGRYDVKINIKNEKLQGKKNKRENKNKTLCCQEEEYSDKCSDGEVEERCHEPHGRSSHQRRSRDNQCCGKNGKNGSTANSDNISISISEVSRVCNEEGPSRRNGRRGNRTNNPCCRELEESDRCCEDEREDTCHQRQHRSPSRRKKKSKDRCGGSGALAAMTDKELMEIIRMKIFQDMASPKKKKKKCC